MIVVVHVGAGIGLTETVVTIIVNSVVIVGVAVTVTETTGAAGVAAGEEPIVVGVGEVIAMLSSGLISVGMGTRRPWAKLVRSEQTTTQL